MASVLVVGANRGIGLEIVRALRARGDDVIAVCRTPSDALDATGATVALLHPGFVRTSMTGGQGLIDADESARGLIALVDRTDAARSGRFFHVDGSELPW